MPSYLVLHGSEAQAAKAKKLALEFGVQFKGFCKVVESRDWGLQRPAEVPLPMAFKVGIGGKSKL